ncbi:MAG: hypothetical protein AB8G15_05185 [Saprospiraceae bacterium]
MVYTLFRYFLLLILCFSLACQEEAVILFQDDFESYPLGKITQGPWTTAGAGAIRIDETNAFSGRQAVQFISGEGYANRAFLALETIFPLLGNQYFGKLNMYLETASPDGIHWTMIQSSGKVAGQNFRAEVRYGGQHQKQLMANYDTQGVTSDCWQHAPIPIPEGRWFSLAWEFNGPQNQMKLWLDGKLIEALTIDGRGEGCVENGTQGQWLFPVVEKLSLGWVDYQEGGGTRKLWIDDVVISKKKSPQKSR